MLEHLSWVNKGGDFDHFVRSRRRSHVSSINTFWPSPIEIKQILNESIRDEIGYRINKVTFWKLLEAEKRALSTYEAKQAQSSNHLDP